ncbi:hypothetical protein [Roseobacter weihaiensis]|uniref:hypothetical protein n=1 Tax=Roseobacter weihaiensis TaxID=2763262 RepID=UPI001D09B9DF|nr:hypothetical protein [Roseobacter sp. H9]
MKRSADISLSDNLMAGPRLYAAFRENDREALMLRASVALCWAGGAVAALQVAHHVFDLPGLQYAWELFLSLCA